MKKRLYHAVFGPVVDGKPSEVLMVYADSFADVVRAYETLDPSCELLSIQILPDKVVSI